MTNYFSVPDVQGFSDQRKIAITRVGIKEVRVPISVMTAEGGLQHTVALVQISVALPHDKKGTHMSRMVRLLNETSTYSLMEMEKLHATMLKMLEASSGTIVLNFPYFLKKRAPVSGEASWLDYTTELTVDGDAQSPDIWATVTVPVTSLCPCSKEISQYGAHNQRSYIVIRALFDKDKPFTLEALIEYAESGSSCPIWSMLKRPDEKYVTEQAYDHPKFVEDIVRDVAIMLNADTRIQVYEVSSENFESIHNHSAYARILCDKRK